MKDVKLIIAGGRDFDDVRFLYNKMHWVLEQVKAQDMKIVEIVSGAQVSEDPVTHEKWGADYLGELWAAEHDIPVRLFPAAWNKLGKRAGFVRNKAMADYADGLVAFWNGESKGTKNMIDNVLKLDKPAMVFTYTS